MLIVNELPHEQGESMSVQDAELKEILLVREARFRAEVERLGGTSTTPGAQGSGTLVPSNKTWRPFSSWKIPREVSCSPATRDPGGAGR